MVSLPKPPFTVKLAVVNWADRSSAVTTVSLPPTALKVKTSLAAAALRMLMSYLRPVMASNPAAGARCDAIRHFAPKDRRGVHRPVSGAVSVGQIDVNRANVGLGDIVDVDDVGSATGLESDLVDARRVDGDGPNATSEAEPRSDLCKAEGFGPDISEEDHLVAFASSAFDGIAAVPWIPNEPVGAGATEELVGSGIVGDAVADASDAQELVAEQVVAVFAIFDVGPTTANDDVVAATAED